MEKNRILTDNQIKKLQVGNKISFISNNIIIEGIIIKKDYLGITIRSNHSIKENMNENGSYYIHYKNLELF